MSQAVIENLARHEIELVRGRGRLGPDRTVTVTPSSDEAGRLLAADVVLIARLEAAGGSHHRGGGH